MAQQRKRRWWSLWGGKKTPPAVAAAPSPAHAAAEVSDSFDDLKGRYEALRGQPQGTAESMAVAHKLFTEAEREAATIKARARRQAEVEAAPVLAEAKRQAQETIAQANAQAHRITEQEAESILRDAHYRANLIEERARQAAQVFLMRCREDVQQIVVLEAKEAFYKLLAPVNEVLSTAQEVEHALKMRAVDLWDNASAQLEDYQPTLLGSLGPGEQERTAQHVAAPAEDAAQASEDAPLMDEVEREEPAPEIAVPSEADEPEQPEKTPAAQAATEGPPVEQAEAEREEGEEAPRARGRRADEEEETKTEAAPVLNASNSYVGELELLIEPYTNVAKISKLYRDIGAIAGVRVVRTSGAWDRGTVITVELSEPITLAALELHLPDVEASPATPGGESRWKSAVGLKRQGSSAQAAVAIAFKSPEKARGDDSRDDGHDHEDAANEPDAGEEGRA